MLTTQKVPCLRFRRAEPLLKSFTPAFKPALCTAAVRTQWSQQSHIICKKQRCRNPSSGWSIWWILADGWRETWKCICIVEVIFSPYPPLILPPLESSGSMTLGLAWEPPLCRLVLSQSINGQQFFILIFSVVIPCILQEKTKSEACYFCYLYK